MKNLLLLSLSFFILTRLDAQFNLEHTYECGFSSFRHTNIPNIGEKYYMVDFSTGSILIYNADHTLWKTIQVPGLPVNVDFINVEIYDPHSIMIDEQLEFYVLFGGSNANGTYVNKARIINESGEVLFEGFFDKIRQSDGREKLIGRGASNHGKVYDLPGITLEHDYGNVSIDYFSVIENNVSKGYYFIYSSSTPNAISIYDEMHSFVNTAVFPFTPGIGQNYAVTKDIEDGTTDFKFLFYVYNSAMQKWDYWMARENGTVLFHEEVFSISGVNPLILDHEYGFNHKKLNITVPEASGYKNKFYKLPEFELEKVLSYYSIFDVDNRLLWAIEDPVDTASTFRLYDPNQWTLEHTFNKPLGLSWYVNEVNRFVFDDDPQFEFLLYESSDNQNYDNPVVKNEDGSILFQESTLPGAYVSRVPGAPNKLICYGRIGQTSNNTYKIYALPSSTPLSLIDHAVTTIDLNVTPNPSAGDVTLGFEKTPSGPVSVEIISLQGAHIATLEQAPSEKITLARALFPAPGLYFVSIRSGDWKGVAKVIIL
jgi:hypothetical protein